MKDSTRSFSFARVLSVLLLASSSAAMGDGVPARVTNDYADLGHMLVTATRTNDYADLGRMVVSATRIADAPDTSIVFADLGAITVTATRVQTVASNGQPSHTIR